MESKTENILSGRARWGQVLIFIGVGLFLIALFFSALVVPRLRTLHFLQALIYVAVLITSMRNNIWAYGAGTCVALVWNSLNLFITKLFQAGIGQLVSFFRTGHVSRPDTLMVAVGGIGHFVLIAGCLAVFLSRPPSRKRWGQFFGGGLIAIAYFALIIILAAPR